MGNVFISGVLGNIQGGADILDTHTLTEQVYDFGFSFGKVVFAPAGLVLMRIKICSLIEKVPIHVIEDRQGQMQPVLFDLREIFIPGPVQRKNSPVGAVQIKKAEPPGIFQLSGFDIICGNSESGTSDQLMILEKLWFKVFSRIS